MATKKSSLLNQLKLEGHSERTMKNCFSSLGRSQGGHAILSSFFQYLYCTVLYEKNPITCFQLSRDVQQSITTHFILFGKGELTRLLCYSTVSQKLFAIFSALNFIVLNLMCTTH